MHSNPIPNDNAMNPRPNLDITISDIVMTKLISFELRFFDFR